MDAIRLALAAGLGAMWVCAGCMLPNQGVTPQPKPADSAQTANTNEVTDATVQAADTSATPEDANVQAWANAVPRLDDLRTRIERDAQSPDYALSQDASPSPVKRFEGANWSDEPNFPTKNEPTKTATEPSPANAPADVAPEATVETQPPVLKEVTLGVQRPIVALTVSDDAPQPVNAPNSSISPAATLREFLAHLAETPTDATFRDEFERRVLYAIAGDDAEARQPLEMFPAEQQELMSGFVELLISLRDAPGGAGREALRDARAAVEQLDHAVRNAGDLTITTFELCRRVGGFGQYDPITPATFPAGNASNEFVAYTQIADFVSRLADDGYWESEFSLRVAVLDRMGQTVHSFEAECVEDRCRSRRRDCFIAPLVRLPATLSPGEYVVKVTVADRIGEKVTERRTALRIVARQ